MGSSITTKILNRFGLNDGTYNETSKNRPITTEGITYLDVGIGKTYSTIQDAANNLPLVIRHLTHIRVFDGTYNEDVFVPPVMISKTTTTEGPIVGAHIVGQGVNRTDVKIKSVTFSGCIGTYSASVNNVEIIDKADYSDEYPCIAFYGCKTGQVKNVKLSGTANCGVLAYGSDVIIEDTEFTTAQQRAVYAKSNGHIILGNSYDSPNLLVTGSVAGDLIQVGKNSSVHVDGSSITYAGKLNNSSSKGKVFDRVSDTLWMGQNQKKFAEGKYEYHYNALELTKPTDSHKYVILLEKYLGDDDNYTFGYFTMKRNTSGNILADIVQVNTFSNNTSGHNGTFSVNRVSDVGIFDLVTCTYNSEVYLALRFDGGANYKTHRDLVTFSGISRSTATENLKLIEYYNILGSVVTNSEINSSIVGFVPTTTPIKVENSPIQLPTYADSVAPNSTLYYSSTASKLVWKDSGGTVNNLY
ncbi:MAG: right-handed parallel beta-helix repeat-containing protein [Nanoarchaeota archaeon]|nr:right-handed parallel beta-helix repeat-containing protein [Nanoarchaeota archaeon]